MRLDLLIALDRTRPSLRAQVEEQLRAAVRDGRLMRRHGAALEPRLAAELGVSRGVVVEAYSQLVAEGYLVARPGGPTRVAHAASTQDGARPRARRRAAARFDFRPGGPDVSLFPRASWLASLRRALRDAPDVRLDYGDPRGAPELRMALSAYLGRVRGVACDPERVIVTSGMAQGMAHLRPHPGRPAAAGDSGSRIPRAGPGASSSPQRGWSPSRCPSTSRACASSCWSGRCSTP